MPAAIFHLERFDAFLHHTTQLNRLYAPEDPVVDLLALDGGAWDARLAEHPEPADDPLLAQALQARRLLHAIHRNFPQGAPLHEQAAYLTRAFVGLTPLPEANARTGWDYTAEVLQHAGHTIEATADEARTLATSLWLELEDVGFGVKDLTRQDEGFASLAAWFKDRIA